ncbi:MAG: FAD-binding protein [Thermodesulfobacteriota bacterium]
MNRISRRDMLKFMGMTGAAALAPYPIRHAHAAKRPVPTVNILKSYPYEDREVFEADLVIVGTGLGGLWAAVTAAEEGIKRIAIVDKGGLGVSSGSGMILAGTIYWLEGDDLAACEKEYLRYSGGLGHPDMLRDMMQTSRRRMEKWKKWGVTYEGLPVLGIRIPTDGNRYNKLSINPRYKGWACGRALVQCLLDRIDAQGVSTYFSKTMITDLLVENGRINGAVGLNRLNGNRIVFKAPSVILATGSCTFGPGYNVSAHQTGDGYALAYRAGSKLQNLEFLNPDVLARDYNLEGGHLTGMFGARFINKHGKDFMWDYDPNNGTNSNFNTIAFAFADEWARGNAPVYLDQTTVVYKYIVSRIFENLSPLNTWQALNYRRLRETGNAPTDYPHNQIVLYYGLQGCIRTDNDLMSDEIDGLFAASLSQSFDMSTIKGISSARGMWSGEKTGRTATRYARGADMPVLHRDQVENALERSIQYMKRGSGLTYWPLIKKFQDILHKPEIGLRKTAESLEHGLKQLTEFKENDLPALKAGDSHELVKAHELENMVLVAELFLKSSIIRTESRYSHRRMEYPLPDNENWLKFINWQINKDNEAVLNFEKQA